MGAGKAPEETRGAVLCGAGVLGSAELGTGEEGGKSQLLQRHLGKCGGGGGMLASLNGLRKNPASPTPTSPPHHSLMACHLALPTKRSNQ